MLGWPSMVAAPTHTLLRCALVRRFWDWVSELQGSTLNWMKEMGHGHTKSKKTTLKRCFLGCDDFLSKLSWRKVF